MDTAEPRSRAQEYAGRLEKLQAAMRPAGLDGLMLTNEANVFYASGHLTFWAWATMTRPRFVFVPATGDPILLQHEVWADAARKDSWLRDVRRYKGLRALPLAEVRDALSDLGLLEGKIGAELGFEQRLDMPLQYFDQLQQALPGVKFVDGSAAIWKARSIKSDYEVERLRRAGRATAEVYAESFAGVREGMTEREIAQLFRAAVGQRDIDFGFFVLSTGPHNYGAMACLPSDHKVGEGDMVWVDLGVSHDHYYSDFSRAIVVGRPSKAQMTLWDKIDRLTRHLVAFTKPGMTARAVTLECQEQSRRLGLGLNFSSGRIGHGLGLIVTEPPHMSLDDDAVLEEGMVITFEPGIIQDDGCYIAEQNLVVRQAGNEVLSAGPTQLEGTGG